MKKALSIGLVTLLVIFTGTFFWLYSSLDSIVKASIEKYGSEITQVSIRVGKVKLSPTDGAGIISGLNIGNPSGFKTPYALNVNSIEIAIEPASITKDVIVIHKIAVAAPSINYETSDSGSNFDVIQHNVNQYLGSENAEKTPGKKMIIETLSIHDAQMHYSPAIMQGKTIDLPLPNLDLHDVGKNKGGVTSRELTKAIIDALKNQMTKSIAQSAKGAVETVGKAARNVGDHVKSLFK